MKTILIPELRKVEIVETPLPKRKEGEALLKILYGGICGSDLGTYRGTFAYSSFPRIPGHEFAAEIVEVDPYNKYGLKPGMIVTGNPYFNCGKCYSCQRGLFNCCEHNETLGAQRDGAFSEFITLPLERIYQGKGLNAQILTLIEPFCISYHGTVTRGKTAPGDKVLVIGAGTIGVFAAIAAKASGASVYICDVAKSKVEYALANFDLDGGFVNEGDDFFKEKCSNITNAKGFDVVIEAVGLPQTFQSCINAAAFGGRVVLIGIGKRPLDFNFTIIQTKELNVFGSRNALKQDFLTLIDLVNKGKVKIDKMITNTFALEDAGLAFAELDTNGAKNLKIQLDFTR